jgi:hypothetical protein
VSYVIDSVVISGVEKNWLAGALLSSKQTMNSLNLDNFSAGNRSRFPSHPASDRTAGWRSGHQ